MNKIYFDMRAKVAKILYEDVNSRDRRTLVISLINLITISKNLIERAL